MVPGVICEGSVVVEECDEARAREFHYVMQGVAHHHHHLISLTHLPTDIFESVVPIEFLLIMAHRPSGKSAIPGVLPISASSAQQNAPKASSSKSAAPRLKLLVRRLPPGLTQAEFETALGEEWTVGKGKVDWFTYRPGKLSTE